jgi:hypothetical protein
MNNESFREMIYAGCGLSIGAMHGIITDPAVQAGMNEMTERRFFSE